MNGNVIISGEPGAGMSYKLKREYIRRLQEENCMKNKNNATDQVVVTEKDNLLIERQETPEKREHLTTYKNMILK